MNNISLNNMNIITNLSVLLGTNDEQTGKL